MAGSGREVAVSIAALGLYVGRILSRVRSEQQRWAVRATRIPDPVLRRQAIDALRQKARNVEGTAVFATLAPESGRSHVVRAGAALQIAVDYLDSLGEVDLEDPLADGLHLHEALLGMVDPGLGPCDPYRLHPRGEDGGYLQDLVGTAAAAVEALPGWDLCAPFVEAAIRRCGEGQARTHAAPLDGSADLRRWAEGLDPGPGPTWWEAAAGASSSVAAHALIASAADPEVRAGEPGLVDTAYFPSIGALTVLLDDLVDFDEDMAMGQHNYTAYYADEREAAERLGLLADMAYAAVAPLPQARRHRAILAGVVGFYLGERAAGGGRARPTRERLLRSSGIPTRILATSSRLLRR